MLTEAHRMRCLELAASVAASADDVLKFAQQFERYVTGGSIQPQDSTESR